MDKIAEIQLPISHELEQFKELFDSSLVSSNSLLNDALNYIKQRKGKMMRPILALLVARLLGEVSKSTYHATVALELLHTASLVHDDVVDESDERRGQASMNARYDNKVSVLVGDYLLASCLVQAGLTENEKIISLIAKLGQDLSEGEILQLSNISNMDVTEYVYFNVIGKKTGALFSACSSAGALSVNASKEQVDRAFLFGKYIGTCFQIRDDIFDYFEDETIGKPTGNDMREGKLTLPVIYALNSTADPHAEKVALKIKSKSATPEEIKYLIEFSKENNGINYAKDIMYSTSRRAKEFLNGFDDSDIVRALNYYVDYVVERSF